jgi:putative holliday junction resolvase
MTLSVRNGDPVGQVVAEIARLKEEEDGLAAVVVGLPTRLDGTASEQTSEVTAFVDALRRSIAIPVVTEGEQLTSREAESRLALRERDWKKRKARLDAAAAAIILQDYLDRHA